VLFAGQEFVDHTIDSNRVDRRHDNSCVAGADGNLIRRLCLHPIDPTGFATDETQVKEAFVFTAEICLNFQYFRVLFLKIQFVLRVDVFPIDDLLKEYVINWTSCLVDLCTDTPNESEDESVHHDFLCVGRDFMWFALFTGFPVLDIRVEDLNHVVYNEVWTCRNRELASAVNKGTS